MDTDITYTAFCLDGNHSSACNGYSAEQMTKANYSIEYRHLTCKDNIKNNLDLNSTRICYENI